MGICGDSWSNRMSLTSKHADVAVKPWVAKERKLFKFLEFDRKHAVSLLLLAF